MDALNKVLFEKEGVFIHTTVARADEDALVPGKIFIWQRKHGIFIEWKSLEELEATSGDPDWTVVDAVGYRQDSQLTESGSVSFKSKTGKSHQKYVIDFEVCDLKSLKRSRPSLGWSYIIFILKDGTTYPALHFHQGGTKAFVKELETYLLIKKSPTDSCLYLVREQDPQALSKSFDELQLFEEQAGHVLNKFINDPVTATMGGFSRVTNFLRDTLLVPEHSRPPPQVPDLFPEEFSGMAIKTQEETGFELVTTRELPPRPDVVRNSPLCAQNWARYMDKDGRITDVEGVKSIIFRGGVEPSLRNEVWKFLLGYYSWDSTHVKRAEQRKTKVDDYFRMKLQWKSITADQERRFAAIRDRKGLIEKDVLRTDRTHPFYESENNKNINTLNDVLMTYCMYNFDLGYVQGMSDLLSPILVLMENEVDAFWCLAGFMEMVKYTPQCHNFEMDQAGMKRQLHQLNVLLRFIDPELCNYLESHDSSNMYFCFRWLLIWFKREFNFSQIMRLWEVLWTGLPCKNFHLLVCIAILDTEKTCLIENNFGFTEILKHINDITGSIDLEPTLKKSEGIYLQLKALDGDLPEEIEDIIYEKDATPDSTPEHRGSRASTPADRKRKKKEDELSVKENIQREIKEMKRTKTLQVLSVVYNSRAPPKSPPSSHQSSTESIYFDC